MRRRVTTFTPHHRVPERSLGKAESCGLEFRLGSTCGFKSFARASRILPLACPILDPRRSRSWNDLSRNGTPANKSLHLTGPEAVPNGPVSSLMLVLALDENEEPALRDKVLKNHPDSKKGPLDWLAVLFRESLARGEKAKLDLDAADKHIAGSPAQTQRVGCYFVG